ncbi:recombination protein RecR [Candidatus Falkowbacteria bacterium RIFOXYB2_FULL_34_18]|uniref:Recombination protein RecR n=1 Tax=Candidatus Falkowbacteria bacterium RIFOXYD2_FULL_34_120 TaxID=1798007 RepID=A0A1F5TN75_9BACT|nr:MAG: recombination protein RecR [Candidatus Falkowbacteria bacterium RIFOXYC12_FULL_34_55]OGF28742.1 MAG: recombination protein RecR [Candidatus Falkowbacteria bacterium RIFOXYB2_FULL_34_18]OGF38107.1 MAG: recombination protein RecR [Candidatus Falkowbacteria bacterium RIFOXYC2_FULL_34_220]OGF38361.1 MAG: recombination protein RecR [Candidatus Falkowbacteria bacterium RIFOXYD12_FULL_34_57]OGF40348.1 MAG: recombination protein RecR [Candidatus Falkowbacteria bacterium RIFOXYD2_FULL_34_120]
MKYPESIQNLIDYFSKLPTVGPKTAERYVFYLLRQSAEDLQKFAQLLAELKEKTTLCKTCFSISDSNPCHICSNQERNQSIICVVSTPQDMSSLESTKEFTGLYHVLGGVLNAIEGIKPEQLTIQNLLNRIKNQKTKEIILALSPNIEGETTSMYLTKLLKPYKVKITRLAKGLSTGSNLEYADKLTLTHALKYRNEL